MYRKIFRGMNFVSILVLVISAVVVFSASYYIFGMRIEKEICQDAHVIADYLEISGANDIVFTEMLDDKSVSVLSSYDGEILFYSDRPKLFANSSEMISLTSIAKANEKGFGVCEGYAKGLLRKMYSASSKLTDGRIITVSALCLDIFSIVTEITIVILVLGVMIFIFSAVVSKKITENIISPIENSELDNLDEENFPYEEFKPFIMRITHQNAEIKRQIDRVKRQKLRLQAVSESMNEGLVVLDREGNILSVNDSAMSFFGTSGKEKYTKTSIMSLTGRDTNFADNIIKALHNERGSFRHDIGDRSYEVFYSPVCDEDKVLGVIILMFDITEKLANEQIRAEFTANVSHELKTPLTSIHGFAQLLSGGLVKAEDVSEFASKIEKESGRLITLVEDIMELSNLDEGAMGEKIIFSVYPMLSEIMDSLKLGASKRGIEISLSGNDFQFNGDSIRVHELLYNIIDNAVKYNKDGGKVEIECNGTDRTVKVLDTGIGIPDEYKERIFERFFRVDKSHSKKVNGTGLGLSIVKHIAKNNGIRIEVDSKLEVGTCFTIYF